MVLGLVASVVLAQGSLLHAFGMILLGLVLGLVGTDTSTGVTRYGFGFRELYDGINFVALATGIFAVGEIVSNLEVEATRTAVVSHQPHAASGGLQAHDAAGPAGDRPWLCSRRPSGRRHDAGILCNLRLREARLQAARDFRQRRY